MSNFVENQKSVSFSDKIGAKYNRKGVSFTMKNPFSFFGAKTRKINELEDYIEKLKRSMPSEAATLADLKIQIEKEEQELTHVQSVVRKEKEELNKLRKDIIEVEDEVLLQSFGLYEPHYSFTSSDHYKTRLSEIREQQKALIKNGGAVTGSTDWTVNGNKAKGKKMVKDGADNWTIHRIQGVSFYLLPTGFLCK